MASPAHQDHACSSTLPRRRRRAVVADAAARDEPLWASLPEDLIGLVAWRVLAGDLRDYVRLRAVCRRWRSGTSCPRGRGVVDARFHPRRWMMLPEGRGLHPGHGKLRGYVRFFNLSTGAFVRARLPIFRDHCVLASVDGVLLLQRDHDTAVRLLHPFTGDILDFPPLETLLLHVNPWFPGDNNSTYLRKVLAASISVGADGLVKVMISLHHIQNVCFATSGDQQWRVSSWLQDVFSVPLGFQGKLYMLRRPESNGAQPEVVQVDPPQQEDVDFGSPFLPPPKSIAKCPQGDSYIYYLVECNSEILVISPQYLVQGGHKFSVYRLADLVLGRNVPQTCINSSTLFLNITRSLCVSSEAFPTIVADTIVAHSTKSEYSVGQYHLKSGTSSAASFECKEGSATLSPCSIIYHIFTCCFREYWNKGQIISRGKFRRWRVKRKWRDGC